VSDEDEHSDEQGGKRDAEAVEPTTHAEDDWEEGLARLREYQALHGHACPRTKWGGSGHKKRSALQLLLLRTLFRKEKKSSTTKFAIRSSKKSTA
jgi:hypothetical protein